MRDFILNRATYALNTLVDIRKEHRLVLVLMLLWAAVTHLMSSPEMSSGINQSVPIMIVISLITFLVLLYVSWWLLERFWQRVGLPEIGSIVLQYKEMNTWHQLGFYFLSFALLVLIALGCLAAVL